MKKYILAFLYLPATFLHEFSHFLIAKLLFVKVTNFSLFPKNINNEFVLGSVTTNKTDLIRGSLIGIAPFLAGALLLLYLFTQKITIISIYFILQVIHSMLLSFSDIVDFVKLILLISIIIAVIAIIM